MGWPSCAVGFTGAAPNVVWVKEQALHLDASPGRSVRSRFYLARSTRRGRCRLCHGSFLILPGFFGLIERLVDRPQILPRAPEERLGRVGLFDQNAVRSQCLLFRLPIASLTQQRTAQLKVRDARVDVVGPLGFDVKLERVPVELFGSRILFAVQVDAPPD